jgi:hypothetical protein
MIIVCFVFALVAFFGIIIWAQVQIHRRVSRRLSDIREYYGRAYRNDREEEAALERDELTDPTLIR